MIQFFRPGKFKPRDTASYTRDCKNYCTILHFWSYKRESWTNIFAYLCTYTVLNCIHYTYMEHVWISDQLDFQHPYLLKMGKSKTTFWQAISFSANQSLYLSALDFCNSPVWRTWFSVYFKLDFWRLHQAEKSTTNWEKNPVMKLDISNWRIAKIKCR